MKTFAELELPLLQREGYLIDLTTDCKSLTLNCKLDDARGGQHHASYIASFNDIVRARRLVRIGC